jgi:hypothetical protein
MDEGKLKGKERKRFPMIYVTGTRSRRGGERKERGSEEMNSLNEESG